MCFNLGIPLVDAGTKGYDAHTLSIKKGFTECYQCVEQPKEKTYPMCTIRQKPDKLIHCIQWAKAFYEGLYGEKGQQNILEDIIEQIN